VQQAQGFGVRRGLRFRSTVFRKFGHCRSLGLFVPKIPPERQAPAR